MSQSILLLCSVPKNITKIAPREETRTEGEKYTEENIHCLLVSLTTWRLMFCPYAVELYWKLRDAFCSEAVFVTLELNILNPNLVNHKKFLKQFILVFCILKYTCCNYADLGLQRLTRIKKTSFTEMIKLPSNFVCFPFKILRGFLVFSLLFRLSTNKFRYPWSEM